MSLLICKICHKNKVRTFSRHSSFAVARKYPHLNLLLGAVSYAKRNILLFPLSYFTEDLYLLNISATATNTATIRYNRSQLSPTAAIPLALSYHLAVFDPYCNLPFILVNNSTHKIGIYHIILVCIFI